MKYFLHDTNAFQDEKITELFMHFGYEGVGLFFTILEKLAMQEKPMKTEVLKKQLFVGKRLEKVWDFMEEIELISSNNGETFNEQLLNFSEKYQIKKEKTREKVSQWRKNQADKKSVTSYVPICNPPKVKESKVNLIKEIKEEIISFCKNNSDDVFLNFENWRDYLIKQHDIVLKENEYTYQILLKTLKKYGVQKTVENIKYSITRNWKQILPEPEQKQVPRNLTHLNQAMKHDSDKF